MPRHLHQIKAVTFDAGGTLLYTYPSVGDIYARVMSKYGITGEPEAIGAAFEASFQKAIHTPGAHGTSSDWAWWRYVVAETMKELGQPTNFDAMFDELWVAFAHPENWRLYDGAIATLEGVRARGYRVALLSNWDDRLRPLLERMEVLHLFDPVIISCDIGAEKPAPAIFEATQSALGLEAAEILHIGDSEHHDYNGALACGWECLIIDHLDRHSAQPHVIRQLDTILEFLPGRS